MASGWDAKGRIAPLWRQLPGGREELAALSGVRATELSSRNSGKKPLGPIVAQKIVDGMAKKGITVSRIDLGAPLEAATDPASLEMGKQLAELRGQVERLADDLAQIQADIRLLGDRIAALGGPLQADQGPLVPPASGRAQP
jgi:hypothetical protein